MNIYDLSLYNEVDHELVKIASELKDDETVDLEVLGMDDEPLYEANGDRLIVPLEKDLVDSLLSIIQNNGKTFNQVFVEAVQGAIDLEQNLDKQDNSTEEEILGELVEDRVRNEEPISGDEAAKQMGVDPEDLE